MDNGSIQKVIKETLKEMLSNSKGVQESYIDPTSSGDEWKFKISPMEEKIAVNYIRKKLLPALIKKFNDDRPGSRVKFASGQRDTGATIDDVDSTIRSLKRIEQKHPNIPKWMTNHKEFTYEATAPNGATFEFVIEKSQSHVVRINSLDPWGIGYMGYELRPNGYPGGPIGFDALMKENVNPRIPLSREDEHRAIQMIKKRYASLFEKIDIGKSLKKIKHIPSTNSDSDDVQYELGNKLALFALRKTPAGLRVELYDWGESIPMDSFMVSDSSMELKESSNENDYQLDILTKEDEMRALQFIRSIVKLTFGDVDFKDLKRVPDRDAPNVARYKTPDAGLLNFRILKLDGKIYIQDDSAKRPEDKHWYPLDYQGTLKENNHYKDCFRISKEEEERALQQIRKFRIGKKTIGKILKKVRHLRGKSGDVIDYVVEDPSLHPHLIRLLKASIPDEGVSLYASFPKIMRVNDTPELVDIPFSHYQKLHENYQPPNLHISKEEEEQMLQHFRRRKNNQGEPIGRHLKKIQHIVSNEPRMSDRIKYKNLDDSTTYTIVKNRVDGKLGWVAGYIAPVSATGVKLGDDYESTNIDYISENTSPVDQEVITKEEEYRALKFIRDQVLLEVMEQYNHGEMRSIVNHGKPSLKWGWDEEKMRKSLRKVSVDNNRIIYKADSQDQSFLFIIKKAKNKIWAGYVNLLEEAVLFDINFKLSSSSSKTEDFFSDLLKLKENAPTGDWQGWGEITQSEKDRLKIVLDGYIRHIRNIYHPNLANTKSYLIKKSIDNLDVSDPRFSAKPLAKLSMEDRLSLGDFVDRADTEGTSSKVMDFLLNISREYVQSPKPSTSDIVLDKVAKVVWPNGTKMSDVTIHGLDDMKPIIRFGYGGYSLTRDFIKEFSKPGAELYIDFGQKVRVVNMPEVMAKVKQSLEQDSRTNVAESTTQSDWPKLSKEDEDRAVQYIRNLTDGGIRFGKTLRKIKIDKSDNENVSDSVFYEAELKDGTSFYFQIFRSWRRGLIVYDGNGQVHVVEEPIRESQNYSKWPSPNKIVITKKEEERAFEWLKRGIVAKQRVGNTLKKSAVLPSNDPRSSDIIIFTAKAGKFDLVYRLYKTQDGQLQIRTASTDGNWSVMKVPMEEAAISSHLNYWNTLPRITMSKKEEDRAVDFLKNKIISGDRLGQTLKKSKVIPSSNKGISSDIMIYTANVKGEERVYKIVKELQSGTSILKVQEVTPGGSERSWLVPT